VKNLKDLKGKVSDVSTHLERLMEGDVFAEVMEAAGKSDEGLLVKICKKADVPGIYVGAIVSLVLALSSPQKYPILW
jgi:hypothetical protein